MPDSLHIVCAACDTTNRVPAARLGDRPGCARCHARLFAGAPAALTEPRFDKHARASDIPLLVDFWASWCGPCRMMAPVFEEAAGVLEPAIRLVKVDSDAEAGLAGRYGIRSIPTLLLVHRGREVARQSGAMPLPQLLGWVRQHTPAG